MKTKIATTILAGFAFSLVGCSSNSSGTSSGTTATVTTAAATTVGAPVGTGTTTLSSVTSNTATFVPISNAALAAYSGHAINSPTGITLTVNLANDGSKRYYGNIQIGYSDNGYSYSGNFTSGSVRNPYIGDGYDGLPSYGYNTWFNYGSATDFNGYFQDTAGSVVLVVDQVLATTNGDALTTTTLSGSVWFHNFNNYGYAAQTPYRTCWYLPYDPVYNCISNNVNNKSSPYPNDTYMQLGTFSGLSTSAFGS